jgi:acyl-CoA thioester hydrolase
VVELTAARMMMAQKVYRGADLLFAAMVTIVCIGPGGRPARLPAKLRSLPLSQAG